MKFSARVAAVALGLTAAGSGMAWAEPVMRGAISREECAQAYTIAFTVNRSTVSRLTGPLPLDGIASTLALGTTEADISGGDALQADPAVFEKKQFGGGPTSYRNLYWQRSPQDGKRLVVAEYPMGWRGDMYDYYMVDPATAPEVIASPDAARKNNLHPFVNDSWMPMQLLQQPGHHALWTIEQENSAWQVQVLEGGAKKKLCDIDFMPGADMEKGLTWLPKPARNFAQLMDGTLGSGRNEGTLEPTAHIRFNVELVWRDAMFRPWALVDGVNAFGPWNSRTTVDAGLAQWAKHGPTYRAHYARIPLAYRQTQTVLETRYRKKFAMTPKEARTMAVYAMDFIYRSYFVFPGEGHSSPVNPWTACKSCRTLPLSADPL